MKIGVISMAHMHAYSYLAAIKKRNDVELIGIADDNEARGKKAAKQFTTTYYKHVNDLLAMNIDAVIITSENSRHEEHVIAAANTTTHILCEKPLAPTVEASKRMIDICENAGVILQVAFPVRFHTSIKRAKQIIDDNQIGDILAISGTNRGKLPEGWFVDKKLSGGGAVLDHTVHVVDVMRWIMKAEVSEVYAEIDTRLSNLPIDDCGLVTMEFDNGVFATLDCSWSRNRAYPTWGDVTIDFIGSKGNLHVDIFQQKLHLYHNDGVTWDYWGDDMDELLIGDFIKTVRTGRTPSVTGWDGLKAVEVAEAAYKAAERKEVVLLNS